MNKLARHLQEKYSHQKIVVLGFGREGKSTLELLQEAFPDDVITIMDKQAFSDETLPRNVVLADYLKNLEQYDVIFKTPGIPIIEAALQDFVQLGKKITSQLSEFLEVYRDQVIGVTGTKGKSTTSALIYHFLKKAEIPTLLIGNIGTPVFSVATKITPEMKLVVEMSSYYLETVECSPHIAVMLNIFPEHLNYHGSLEHYVAAKAHITAHQTEMDYFLFNAEDEHLQDIAKKTKAYIVSYEPSKEQPILEPFAEAMGHLPTIVQEQNVLPAFLVARICKIKDSSIAEALRTFETLPHRLQRVGTYKGITFIDDTLATIPEATVSAIHAFLPIDVIILGGFDRGLDYTKVVDAVIKKKIPTVLFFRPSGEKMYDILLARYKKEQIPDIYFVNSMEETVQLAFAHAKQGSVVLLSPASPSFGVFKDYEDKSTQYIHWIKTFGAK
jgi:UDP-N-acetylmuramoylalanine--D-glutamate ligase